MKNRIIIAWAAIWYLLAVKRRGYAEGHRVILRKEPERKPFDWAKWQPIDLTPVPARSGNTAEFRAKIQELRREEG